MHSYGDVSVSEADLKFLQMLDGAPHDNGDKKFEDSNFNFIFYLNKAKEALKNEDYDCRQFQKDITVAKHLLVNEYYLKNYGIKIQSPEAREILYFQLCEFSFYDDAWKMGYSWSLAKWPSADSYDTAFVDIDFCREIVQTFERISDEVNNEKLNASLQAVAGVTFEDIKEELYDAVTGCKILKVAR